MKRLLLYLGLLCGGLVLVACGGGGGASPADNSGLTDLATFTSDTRVGADSGAVTGQVLDSNGQPLANVEVIIAVAATRQASGTFTVSTDAGGVFRIGNVPPGRYTITIRGSGAQTTTFEIEILANAVTTAEPVQLEPTITGGHGRIVGTVQSTSGIRLQNAKLTATGGSSTRAALTTDSGEYKLTDLPAGTYALLCVKEGYESATATVVVEAGSDRLFRFVLHTPTAQAGRIRGVARNDSGQALVGVTVVASVGTSAVTATTNANGVYEFDGLSPGDYQLRAGKEGYTSLEIAKVTVTAGATTAQDLTLSAVKQHGQLSGRVTDTNGTAIAGAKLTASLGSVHVSVESRADGEYTILDLAPGTYALAASKTGYHPAVADNLVVKAGQTTEANLKLTAISDSETKGRIFGTVRNGEGKAIPGARVYAFAGEVAVDATTNAEGRYELLGLVAGAYSVRAHKDGYQDAVATNVHVTAGATTNRDLTLAAVASPNGRLSGTVIDSLSNWRAGATVSITDGAHQYQINSTINGAYTIPDVVPGTYKATCSLNHYGTAIAEHVSVAAGHTTTLNFTLHPKPGSLAGVVRDSHGTVVAGATVMLGTGSNQRSVQTNLAGRYEIAQLAAGNYTATASKTGYNPDSAAVTIGIDAQTEHDFVIQQTTGTITGYAKDAATLELLNDVLVTATNGTVQRSTRTDAQGIFTIDGLEPGTYSLTASLAGYVDGQLSGVVVTAAATAQVKFLLDQDTGGGSGRRRR